jgi:hypothetical protein
MENQADSCPIAAVSSGIAERRMTWIEKIQKGWYFNDLHIRCNLLDILETPVPLWRPQEKCTLGLLENRFLAGRRISGRDEQWHIPDFECCS